MPSYMFKDKVTGETHEKRMSIADREQYFKDNPNLESVIQPTSFVYESGSRLKVDNGYREMISKIKEKVPNSNIKDH